MKTWGHQICPIGATTRAWLRAGPRCVYLLRYVTRSKRMIRTVTQPLSAKAAAKKAAELGLALPAVPAHEPFATPEQIHKEMA